MTIARPMFPPRADSTHAIPPELAAQQRARLKAIRRVSKLRQKASDEIERLLAFLDASDPYASTELEPSLEGYSAGGDDREGDPSDDEPALGSPENHPSLPYTKIGYTGGLVVYGPAGVYRDGTGAQEGWGQGNRDDREGDPGCDDREPDSDAEPGADNEPAFGWTEDEAAAGRYPSMMGVRG